MAKGSGMKTRPCGTLALYLNLVGSRVNRKVAQDPGQPAGSATTEPCVTEGAVGTGTPHSCDLARQPPALPECNFMLKDDI